MLKIILWAILGWLVGYLINQLADFFAQLIVAQEENEELEALSEEAFPETTPSLPPATDEEEEEIRFSWRIPGIVKLLRGERDRIRPFLLELLCILLFGALPLLIPNTINLIVNSIHIAILILIMIVDLENKAVFSIIIYPALVVALIGSYFVTTEENSIGLAVVGALVGFVIFWVLYKLAQLRYGKEAGALGFGDVQIALLMGAMLGFQRIIFALILAMILGGVFSAAILAGSRNVDRRTALPYGQYLTIAAIIMLIWGAAYVEFYWS